GIIPGAMLGAGIMGMVEVLTSAYISSTMRDAIAFLVLLIVLLIKPAGLLSKSSIEKV
ncbi:MAG: branched-chain amino acid ABC transporter permease, partial [candidate division WOR-3 bacterium]